MRISGPEQEMHILDVETNVITRSSLLELLVVHFDGLDFGCDI